jgi:hypothetical protein
MNDEKFNSQVCTSVEQSKRLLELGLKPETADCFHWEYAGERYIGTVDDECPTEKDVPAWSLHRLLEIAIKGNETLLGLDITHNDNIDDCYERLICDIEQMIGSGYFNKEYLKKWKELKNS